MPTIALFGEGSDAVRQVAAVLRDRESAVHVETWEAFEQLMVMAHYGVVVYPNLDPQIATRLRQLRRRYPMTPIVLTTAKDFDNARRLASVDVDDVVWIGEERNRLWMALDRSSGSTLSRVTRSIEAATMSERLCLALIAACRSLRPVTSVKELAIIAHCSRATLRNDWDAATRYSKGFSLAEFLDWVFLLRAFERRRPGRTWQQVADELSTYQSVLSRLARRLTGHTLRELERADASGPSSLFEHLVLSQLLQ
jgi:hypothetical protein